MRVQFLKFGVFSRFGQKDKLEKEMTKFCGQPIIAVEAGFSEFCFSLPSFDVACLTGAATSSPVAGGISFVCWS